MLPKAKLPALKDANIVKIAVEYSPGYQAQLIEFDQRQPLIGIIQDLCDYSDWLISEAENYALQFCEPSCKNYVTEKNRNEVKNGSVLKLTFSPSKAADDILKTLESGSDSNKTTSLTTLSCLSKDYTFATEFIKKKGLDLIIKIIEDDKSLGDMLKYVLLSFVELMEHGIVLWEILEPSFIGRNILFINQSHESEIIQSALAILDNIVQNSSKANLVERDVKLDNLLRLLEESESTVQQNSIALINSLFQKSDDQRKKQISLLFSTKKYRDVITSSVIRINMGSEMTHQLYVFQTLTLGLLGQRMMTTISENEDSQNKIKELRRIAFNVNGADSQSDYITMRRPNNSQSNNKNKLGFKCELNIAQSFTEIPPGMLALDCLVYFARNYTSVYTKIVHEINATADEHECPMGEASIELVKLLCELLRIGEPLSEQGQDFYPMFFSHDHPFEELFCICIEVLNRTWKDMRATNKDFTKVFSVAREQIVRTLKGRPTTLNDFKTNIKIFTYNKITQLRQQERASKEECESTASAIVSLKKKLTPEIMSLIREQRLGYLVEGSRFQKYNKSGQRQKDKFWYARLSTNHKVIHYGDSDEKTVPTVEELEKKINICDIKQLLVGKECPNALGKRRNQNVSIDNLFSIVYSDQTQQPCEPLDFIALDELTQNYWADGINALLNLNMQSKQKFEDLETLLSMEIKLRLLDTEGVDISKEAPLIPDEPENYDFCFES